jgi:hypothetical protein
MPHYHIVPPEMPQHLVAESVVSQSVCVCARVHVRAQCYGAGRVCILASYRRCGSMLSVAGRCGLLLVWSDVLLVWSDVLLVWCGVVWSDVQGER